MCPAVAHAIPDGIGNDIVPYNVSIGTTAAPSATLEVEKRGADAAAFMISGAATTNGDFLIVASTGNIGIGSTVPRSRLDLLGGDVVIGSGSFDHASAADDLYVTGNLEVDGTIYGNGAGLSNVAATQITYDDAVYTSVEAALNHLLYVSPVISSFSNSVNAVEIGSTVSSTVLNWTINKTITSQSLDNSIGAVAPASLRTYTYGTSYTANKTFTLTVNDGASVITASTSVYFMNKRYWGVSSNPTLNDAQIIALSSELESSRGQTRNGMTPSAQYIYFAYPASWNAATFTVNGLLNTDWTLSTQDHVNSTGLNTTSYRVYRTNNLLTGSYNIVVN